MTANTTATHTPGRPRACPTCADNRSLRSSASEPAVVGKRIAKARTPTATTAVLERVRATRTRAIAAAAPVGTHATTIRASGCAPRRASSSSGSAPR